MEAAMRVRELFRWEGTVGRSTYVLAGLIALAVKHNLDRLIASAYGLRWNIWSSWLPLEGFLPPTALSANHKAFLLVLFLAAIPFIWFGLVLTVRRLRDAGQATWLAVFFFAPVLNLMFFFVLCLLPENHDPPPPPHPRDAGRPPARFWPTTKMGSALIGVLLATLFGLAGTWVGVSWLGNYGLSLFLALPFAMGYLTVWAYSRRSYTRASDVLTLVSLSVLLCGLAILGVAIEGLVCLLMAAPIAWVLALFGGFLAMKIHNLAWQGRTVSAILPVVLVSVPLLMGTEHVSPPPVARYQVHTAIAIAASPEVVWSHLIRFPPLEPPKEWPFRYAGIAYPIEAHLTGDGLTADRECRFSTGSFKEPILAWETGRHFAFSVSDEPVLMTETSPYGQIRVRHLDDRDFQPERADFVLTPLPNGGTRLEGTTTYINRMWPGAYWHVWTDTIVHSIHNRVFEHIKRLSETDTHAEAARVSDSTR
jgi:uncharacterized membrane protein YhaH (DUF805 family)